MGGALLVVKPLAPGHADAIEFPILLSPSEHFEKALAFTIPARDLNDAVSLHAQNQCRTKDCYASQHKVGAHGYQIPESHREKEDAHVTY